MVLLINICREKLHYLEFVKPIEDILKKEGIKFKVRDYKELEEKDLEEEIIICGTSLKDDEFLKNIKMFEWIKNFDGKLLGICGGMEIIGVIFGGKIRRKKEIGFYFENFKKEFLGLKGRKEVYHLHKNYVDFGNDFKEFTTSKINQAVKHRKKEIYGVLFHPEVRNKEVILEFLK